MIKFISVVVILASSAIAMAQGNDANRNVIGDLEEKSRAGGMLTQIPMSNPATKGNSYLNDQWMMGDIEFYGGEVIENKLSRYDLANHSIEVKFDGFTKAIGDQYVKTLSSVNVVDGTYQYYVNVEDLEVMESDEPYVGLVRMMRFQGYWDLIVRTDLQYIEASYNKTLDMGSNENKINKKEKYFIYSENGFVELEKKRKLFFMQFGEKYEEPLKQFVKSQQLNTTKFEDIGKIVVFANAIKSQSDES